MIYFDINKRAHSYIINNPLCVVEDSVWQEYSLLTQGIEYDVTAEGIIDLRDSAEYKEKQAQKEKERIAMLSLTRGDVFRGLLLARGVTRLQLRGMIEANEQLTEVQKEMALIDFDEALNFYRGNTWIDTVGLALGIESEQLDCFFETNDYTCLLPKEETTPAENL